MSQILHAALHIWGSVQVRWGGGLGWEGVRKDAAGGVRQSLLLDVKSSWRQAGSRFKQAGPREGKVPCRM